MKTRKKERILVLNIDRDNDIGRKAFVKGPVIGRERVLETAIKMGLSDPEDTDFNALFQTVKVYDEIKKQYKTEVAVLTGDAHVGIKSDKEIAKQLDEVLKKFNAGFVIFVTDGKEDEYVIPIVQSKVPILSVRRVVVRQAKELESTYYKVKDFLADTEKNPKLARFVLGLPALMLIIYALFGLNGWRFIIGVLGVYLFIKGFRLDDVVVGAVNEFRISFTRRRFAFFGYVTGIVFVVLGTYSGYEACMQWLDYTVFEIFASFVTASIYYYFLGGTLAWLGRNISIKKRRFRKVLAVPVFGLALSIVIYYAARIILFPQTPTLTFLLSIATGFVLMFIAAVLEWK
ncbi:MAG: hypothetical protein DRP13_02830 [Candidatus Aenigmatarchaeota archaeon]|nr:MAG: hypothetical protein DRP18_00125 [Candidatus Aenigmarchaeota archaeon]RLJ08109.1 MAG: hypothetical protein DRP13_02830 [Candidatus Aenigmarchaeota archaeon]RLJ08254.1 MAG: hypothetical protein DRP16_01810 [Candidatus Aenigmarchaeota archaeon]